MRSHYNIRKEHFLSLKMNGRAAVVMRGRLEMAISVFSIKNMMQHNQTLKMSCLCAVLCSVYMKPQSSSLFYVTPFFAGRITIDCSNVLLCKDDKCGLGERKTNPGNSSVRVKQCVQV